ncbi:hypothetical protein BDFB_010288 [Asbolus verrucosus]|uniref:Uncharacterized protein n=1 Tax=Asbolus verrucosus TaxID=1661398 RepID=A0A482WC53_ASBVE|nr:hypothetical protein BDFB_010288 [Asbolus verrucosus]
MVFILEEKSFMLESYFRNARKENGEWKYPSPDCVEEFRIKFPRTIFQYQDFVQQLKYSEGPFHKSRSVARKQLTGPKNGVMRQLKMSGKLLLVLLKLLSVTCHKEIFLVESRRPI